jgi:integrase
MSKAALLEMPAPVREPAKRGTRGRGNIFRPSYKMKDGTKREASTWWIRYVVNGERINENTHSTKKQYAEKLLTDRLGKVDRGEVEAFEAGRNTTLKDVGDLLRASYAMNKRRSTGKIELSLRRLEDHFGADFKVVNLNSDTIEGYRAARRKQNPKLSEQTIGGELVNLHTAMQLGYKADKVKKVPHIELPSSSDRYEDGEFSSEQFWQVHGKLKDWMKAPVEFLYRMGWRAEEAFGLKWSEVWWEQNEIRLPGRRTKSGKERPVPLAGRVLELLKEQRSIVPKDCEWVFPGPGVERIVYDRACDNLQSACRKVGIGYKEQSDEMVPNGQFTDADGGARHPGFHDLRRTFARMMNRAGVPLVDIMRIGGWKTMAMVARYCGDSQQGARESLVRADGIFG